MSVDRRAYPRFPINFPVEVELFALSNAQNCYTVEGVNLSHSSIEICCNSDFIRSMLAQDDYPHTCKLNFQLPDLVREFEILAQVVTHRRLSQHKYYLVLVFVEMDERHETRLEQYLLEKQSSGLLKSGMVSAVCSAGKA